VSSVAAQTAEPAETRNRSDDLFDPEDIYDIDQDVEVVIVSRTGIPSDAQGPQMPSYGPAQPQYIDNTATNPTALRLRLLENYKLGASAITIFIIFVNKGDYRFIGSDNKLKGVLYRLADKLYYCYWNANVRSLKYIDTSIVASVLAREDSDRILFIGTYREARFDTLSGAIPKERIHWVQ